MCYLYCAWRELHSNILVSYISLCRHGIRKADKIIPIILDEMK